MGILLKETEKGAGGSAVGPVAAPMAPFTGSGGWERRGEEGSKTQAESEKQQVRGKSSSISPSTGGVPTEGTQELEEVTGT